MHLVGFTIETDHGDVANPAWIAHILSECVSLLPSMKPAAQNLSTKL